MVLHFRLDTLSAALGVLTAMITPALLISACGTFILSTSNRLGRVVDRVRTLSDKFDEMAKAGPERVELFEERRQLVVEHIDELSVRARLLQRSLSVFYFASAVFVATSVAIGLVSATRAKYHWVPVGLGIVGGLCLLYGSLLLIVEARLAVAMVRSETAFLMRLVSRHRDDAPPEQDRGRRGLRLLLPFR